MVSVETWADSVGLWHARVSMDVSYETARRKARKAIVDEILSRQSLPVGNVKIRYSGLRNLGFAGFVMQFDEV